MNIIVSVITLLSVAVITCAHEHLYDRYSGKKIVYDDFFNRANIMKCAITVKHCSPHEGSRVDGTCNNHKYPTRGSARGPYLRLLNPDYAHDNQDIRKGWNGQELPSARKVRTTLQTDGRVADNHGLNTAALHFLQFIQFDVSFLIGPWDYIKSRLYCCKPEGRQDPRCLPVPVPDDDPYLGMTDIRCLNFSRAETFQNDGCIDETSTPEQINIQTPVIDLSTVYGVDEKSHNSVRMYQHGLLNLEYRNFRLLPLANLDIGATKPEDKVCLQNMNNETRCYVFGFPGIGNVNLRTTSFAIFFMREHNRLAKALHRLNPCWKDDQLFKVARQINIATASNILMYELLPMLLGYENMLKYGLISDHVQHIKEYDEDAVPLIYAEFDMAMRYYHTLQEGRIKLYDEKYHYDGQLSNSKTTLRQSVMEVGNNYENMNRGTFYQPTAGADDIQDPGISEKYYGDLQRASDLPTLDIQRGRDVGIRGYNDYRHICGLKPAKKFEDFADVMDHEKIESLKNLYDEIEDVDLLAGIMSESFMPGTLAGPTLFCIVTKQLQLLRFADRFWFERGDQFHSLTLPQLHEVRKTNIARFACDNADGINFIQPRAFETVGPHNLHVPCTHIPGLDIMAWKDNSCYNDQHYDRNHSH